MDSANKKVAIVPETVQGTTPATPGFLTLRDTRTEGAYDRPFGESPERRSDGMLGAMVKMPTSMHRRITMPLAYDAAFDQLLQSFQASTWSTNVLKNGVILQPFTLEEIYNAPLGAPGPWIRSQGLVVDAFSLNLPYGKEGEAAFDCVGFNEATASSAIAGATYAVPSTDEPMTPIDSAIGGLAGLTTPKVMSLQISARRNIRRNFQWTSADAFRTGFGRFRVDVAAQIYFQTLAEYTAIAPGLLSTLDITLGFTTLRKYRFQLPNAKFSAAVLNDPGNDGDVMLSFKASAIYDVTTGAALQITRAVA
jgi:hypothetical protein